MNINKEEKYVTITPKADTVFTDFFQQFNNATDHYLKDNLILDFSNFNISVNELNKFNEISEKKIELGTSFVIIKKEIDLDQIPDELIVVPTFQEAIDMIEMDEMTRSLDF